MATLLHLSDLHLTGAENPSATSDHKVRVIPRAVAGHRAQLLMSSLAGLGEALREVGEELDAIIVTGDIADKGRLSGYAQLQEVLSALGPSLPVPERILIVAGNHDVDRGAVGEDRFAGIRSLRDSGYLVGWLSATEIGVKPAPILTARDNSYVLVGLNSSEFSGSQLETETDLAKHLAELEERAKTDPATHTLLDAWHERGKADIARMSGPELQEIHNQLGKALSSGPLRIVGLHHQVLPVGTAEEIKAFESILNLGHLRRWMASNQMDLVLHGHKHDAAVIRDRINTDGAHDDHEMTVLSAPSISTARGAGDPIGQLIRVSPRLPRLRGYEIVTVPAAEQGAVTDLANMPRRTRPLDEVTANGLVSGADVDATYARITAVLDRLPELPTPMVCRIDDGSSGLSLPADMPHVPEPGKQRDEWLDTVIDWWQSESPGRAAKFNHGQFLHASTRGRASAVERIVEELGKKQGATSRALAVLVNQDTLSDGQEFPSFISLQFVLRGTRLDAVAYFRKQEMSHWWPINVVEVARIQKEVIARMPGSQVTCGSITTITGMPVRSLAMPTVSVPELDLRVDRPGGMLDLVLPLYQPTAKRADIEAAWAKTLEWLPGEVQAEGDPRPLLGLKVLAETLQSAAAMNETDTAMEELISRLDELHHINDTYKESNRQAWAVRARRSGAYVLKALASVLNERVVS